MPEGEQTNPIASVPQTDSILVQEGIHKLGPELPHSPSEIAELLSTSRTLDITGLESKLLELRVLRKIGASDRWQDKTAVTLDRTIAELLHRGDYDLVRDLISCSQAELDQIGVRIDDVVEESVSNANLKHRLLAILEEKQAKFITELNAHGAESHTANTILREVGFPETALEVSPEFWALFKTLPYDVQKIMYTPWRDPAKTAGHIESIHTRGLDSYAELLVRNIEKATSDVEAIRYLDSAKALLQTLSGEPIFEGQSTERGYTFTGFFDFADPDLAYKTAIDLFGIPNNAFELRAYGQKLQNIVHGYYLYTSPHIEINPLFIASWKMIAADLSSFSDAGAWTELCASNMRSLEQPEDFVEIFKKALPLLQKHNDKYLFLKYKFVDSTDPISFITSFDRLEPYLDSSPNSEIPQKVLEWLGTYSQPEVLARRLTNAFQQLDKCGLPLSQITFDDFSSFTAFLASGVDAPVTDREIDRFISLWKIRLESGVRYKEYVSHLPESDWRGFAKIPRPDLSQFPLIVDQFSELGIEPELADRLFRSWSSYSAASRATYKSDGESYRALTPKERDDISKDQTKHTVLEVRALTGYADQYGKEELKEVINMFGIHHFSLYMAEKLHSQIEMWKDGRTPIENIVINAHTDWNGSSSGLGGDSLQALGSGNTCFFEVGSELELANVMVDVGNRERTHGREPEQANSVKNVLIHAHANREGLLLGVDNETLSLADYLAASRNRTRINGRINNYRRHLGNNYRVLLQACSTADQSQGDNNIAHTIADQHDTLVEGSPFITSGMLMISTDGTVTFSTTEGKVPSVSYSGK